jgi:hypothetical protein
MTSIKHTGMRETSLKTHRIRITGPAARGVRIDGALLRDLLHVFVVGCQQAVRLNVEGRSTAKGKPPAWLERAATFEVVGLHEGSTVLVVEAPSLADSLPEHFGQSDLFRTVDIGRSCLDLLEESIRDAIAGRAESDAYDEGLVRTFEEFSRVLRHGVETVELGDGSPLRIDAGGVEALRRLRRAIPPDQQVCVAGKLDVLRHRDRMFTLILETGTNIRGVVNGDTVDLSALGGLWGQEAVVRGVAKFRPSGSVLRIEAERIDRADPRDLILWSAEPRPVFDVLDDRALRQSQGPRSGVNAIFGQLPDIESDGDIIEALDRLS